MPDACSRSAAGGTQNTVGRGDDDVRRTLSNRVCAAFRNGAAVSIMSSTTHTPDPDLADDFEHL